MNDIQVKLEQFEGPLDLLLHLISTNEMDIYDIQISVIIEQYMQYIYTADELNISLAGDFIVMAATLLEIKSKKLLPAEETNQEEIDPEQQLIDRLIEYKVFKLIGDYVKSKESFYKRLVTKEAEYYHEIESSAYEIDIDLELLAGAMSKVSKKLKLRVEDLQKPYVIQREDISVEDMMLMVAGELKEHKRVQFFSLFAKNSSKSRVVAIFLAILELYKTGEIRILQDYQYADIMIESKAVA